MQRAGCARGPTSKSAGSGSGRLRARHETFPIEHPSDEPQCQRIYHRQSEREQDCDREARLDHIGPEEHDHPKGREARDHPELLGDSDLAHYLRCDIATARETVTRTITSWEVEPSGEERSLRMNFNASLLSETR